MNEKLFLYINNFAQNNVFLDKTMIILAQFMPFVFIFVLLVLWFAKKDWQKNILYAGYSLLLGLLINLSISLFYFHPRPFAIKLGKTLIHHSPDSSFPSDHTTFMLSIAFSLLFYKKTRWLGIVFSALGIIGGVSRIYCGVHYPLDILASGVVSLFASWVIFKNQNKFKKLNKVIIKNLPPNFIFGKKFTKI